MTHDTIVIQIDEKLEIENQVVNNIDKIDEKDKNHNGELSDTDNNDKNNR